MRVKRWLLLVLAGVTLLALGLAYLLIDVYRAVAVPPAWQRPAEIITLQPIPQLARALLFGAVGAIVTVVGLIGLNRSLLDAVRPQGMSDLLALVDRRRRSSNGPKVVAIGGGTGLSTLLRGLKENTSHLTAIVTVADDGGSSGRLRRSLGVHPPGDFRQCIAALADTEPLMQSLFEYRFGDGELGGHAFGNLFIVAMTGITGSFESALRASSRVLAVHGRILPSTLTHVALFAELEDDRVMAGESQVPHGRAPIRRVFLEPADPPAYPEAVAAILDADLVVLGPGSLYTSVLPNLLVPDIAAALAATTAPIAYVANVATQPGETDGYDLADHLRALRRHVRQDIVDWVLVNDNYTPDLPESWKVTYVQPGHSETRAVTGQADRAATAGPTDIDSAAGPVRGAAKTRPAVIAADLVDELRPTRHDPVKLAAVVAAQLRANGSRKQRAA